MEAPRPFIQRFPESHWEEVSKMLRHALVASKMAELWQFEIFSRNAQKSIILQNLQYWRLLEVSGARDLVHRVQL